MTITRRSLVPLAVLCVTASLAACSSGPGSVSVDSAMIGETSGEAGALYLTVRNGGDTADQLRGGSCSCADELSLHITDTSGGRSAMQQFDELEIPASETVTMAPAGTHVMLERLTGPLVAGQQVDVELDFASGPQTVTAEVVPLSELNELVDAP